MQGKIEQEKKIIDIFTPTLSPHLTPTAPGFQVWKHSVPNSWPWGHFQWHSAYSYCLNYSYFEGRWKYFLGFFTLFLWTQKGTHVSTHTHSRCIHMCTLTCISCKYVQASQSQLICLMPHLSKPVFVLVKLTLNYSLYGNTFFTMTLHFCDRSSLLRLLLLALYSDEMIILDIESKLGIYDSG